MIAATPGQGGATWAVLQYLLGLRRLGCPVTFVEPVPVDRPAGTERHRWVEEVMAAVGLEDDWALVGGDGTTAGLSRAQLRQRANEADLLLNVSGMLTDDDVLGRIGRRVFVDLDPAFVQLWHAVDGVDMGLSDHTHFVTIADAIGSDDCPIPTCDRTWIPTLPPVVLAEWPVGDRIVHDALTTVGHWRSYGSVHHDGVAYGQKAHSLRELIDLPSRTTERISLALAIHPAEVADLDALERNGWTVLDPEAHTATPDAYRAFVAGSRAELCIAKQGYVVSDSGWFSDRSACYLASGRPVLAQDTGLGRRLPTGEGLLVFDTVDDILAGLESLRGDYQGHRRAARSIAEEHLDSDRVLAALLGRLGV